MKKNRFAVTVAIAGAMVTCAAQAATAATAVFAGGCFWSVESDFDHVPGVLATTSGFTGGTVANPGYMDVVRGGTGHREAVQVEYDPDVISYEELVDTFFRFIDPTEANGQFCDFGYIYTTAVYVSDDAQRGLVEAEIAEVADYLGKPVATVIEAAAPFYPAEDYHQNFWQKADVYPHSGWPSNEHYKAYRAGCGKNHIVQDLWGDQAFRGLDGHL